MVERPFCCTVSCKVVNSTHRHDCLKCNSFQCSAILLVQASNQPIPLSLIFMMATAAASCRAVLAIDWRIFLEYYFWHNESLLCSKHYCKGCQCFWIGRKSQKLPPSSEGISTPSNIWFLGPTRVTIPNGISISLAVFADRPWYSICSSRLLSLYNRQQVNFGTCYVVARTYSLEEQNAGRAHAALCHASTLCLKKTSHL